MNGNKNKDYYKKIEKNNDIDIIININKMFSIWFWFFFLILVLTLCFCILDDTIGLLVENIFVLLPFFLYLMAFSCMLEYVIIRTFKGSEGEAFSTAILTILTALSLHGGVGLLKNSNHHED